MKGALHDNDNDDYTLTDAADLPAMTIKNIDGASALPRPFPVPSFHPHFRHRIPRGAQAPPDTSAFGSVRLTPRY